MLDLKKLEEKLDIALEKETSESLSNWLYSKRNKASAFLGEGLFMEKNSIKTSFNLVKASNLIYGSENVNLQIEQQYKQAA